MIRKLSPVALALFLATVAARATDPPSRTGITQAELQANAYYQLYVARLDMTRATVEKMKAQLGFYSFRKDMMARLYSQRAASREEYLESAAQYDMGVAIVKEAEIGTHEASALLNLAKMRILNGQEMPICTIQR